MLVYLTVKPLSKFEYAAAAVCGLVVGGYTLSIAPATWTWRLSDIGMAITAAALVLCYRPLFRDPPFTPVERTADHSQAQGLKNGD